MRAWYVAAALLCGLVVGSSAWGQSTVAVRSASDRDGSSTTLDAGPFALRPEGLGTLLVGNGFDDPNLHWRAGMEFALAGVLPTVVEAKLRFNVETVQNPPAAYRTHGYAGDGVVTAEDLTVNNQIAATANTDDLREVDVTAFVQSLVTQQASHAGIVLSGFAGGRGFSMTSGEPFVLSPTLTITSIPEPTAALTALLGGTLSCLRRRRLRQR
jgi:hypothetical protein